MGLPVPRKVSPRVRQAVAHVGLERIGDDAQCVEEGVVTADRRGSGRPVLFVNVCVSFSPLAGANPATGPQNGSIAVM